MILDHRGDHVVLVPRRHHDRDGLLLARVQLLDGERRIAALDRHAPLELARPVPDVDEEIVQARKQDDRTRTVAATYSSPW